MDAFHSLVPLTFTHGVNAPRCVGLHFSFPNIAATEGEERVQIASAEADIRAGALTGMTEQ